MTDDDEELMEEDRSVCKYKVEVAVGKVKN